MKFSAEPIESPWFIRAYEPVLIQVGDERHRSSLLLMPERLLEPWPVESVADLAPEALAVLPSYRPDLVLLGTGAQLHFPPPRVLAPLVEAGIGHEVMDTAAACRTWNILLSEGRRVLAALVV
jgi:uncharacterized protein